jgi:hypothetical protein
LLFLIRQLHYVHRDWEKFWDRYYTGQELWLWLHLYLQLISFFWVVDLRQ